MSVQEDLDLVAEVFHRVTGDLSVVVGQTFAAVVVTQERVSKRPAGEGSIHISFKLGFQRDGLPSQGCFLIPLRAAIVLAGHLLMKSDEDIAVEQGGVTLDEETKEGMLELSNFAANATEAAFKNVGQGAVEIRSQGCQGVRADVRPALVYEEGDELLVGRAQAELAGVDGPFQILLLLPVAAIAELAAV